MLNLTFKLDYLILQIVNNIENFFQFNLTIKKIYNLE